MGVREIGLEGVGWFNLVRDRDWWQVPAGMVMNFEFH
jgi:hypothetical protein